MLRRWRRLDVTPFLCIYALWAAWALELLIKEGGAKLGIIQLVTTAVLAVHVSTRRSGQRLRRLSALQGSAACRAEGLSGPPHAAPAH